MVTTKIIAAIVAALGLGFTGTYFATSGDCAGGCPISKMFHSTDNGACPVTGGCSEKPSCCSPGSECCSEPKGCCDGEKTNAKKSGCDSGGIGCGDAEAKSPCCPKGGCCAPSAKK